MHQAAKDNNRPGHVHAERIINRNHFRVLYEGALSDIIESGGEMKAGQIAEAAKKEFGEEHIRHDCCSPKDSTIDFPVRKRDGAIVSAHSISQVLKNIPAAGCDYVFVDKEILPTVKKWYEENKAKWLSISPHIS